MQKRLRDLLRVLVADLRHTLSGGPNRQRGDLDRELERLGIAPDGTVTPFDALPNPTPAERRARRVAEAQLAAAPFAQRAAARAEIVDRAAYTWINRLLALRAAEARGLINEILRSDPAYDGLSEALFILRQTQPQRAAGPDGGWWAVIEDACRAQAASLPGLFGLADPSAALRPSVPALLRCVAIVGNPPAGYTADEAEATFSDPDAIGWAYQFYQEEAKARTYAKLNSGGKAATRAEIAAVTQLFTEPYMVKWLLQNSLGRTYHELYPDSRLPETWEYYIRETTNQRISESRDACSPIRSLADLTFMDPCMGSGHFEREAFDMYFAMYREQYPDMSATEIADRILTRHLHGIDLDPRAAQLAALTLYMRAWEVVRDECRAKRLPGPGSYRPPAMNLATTPTGLTPGSLERHLQRHPEDRIYRPLLEGIFTALEQADVLGSLLRPGEQLDAAIQKFRTQSSGQLGLLAEDGDLNRLLGELARHDPAELKRVLLERVTRSFASDAGDADDVAMSLFGREAGEGVRLLQLLSRKYAAVATNPPYLSNGSMQSSLRETIGGQYQAGKRDLYTAFILRCLDLAQSTQRIAMVTQQGWMFQRSFHTMRANLEESPKHAKGEAAFRGILHVCQVEFIAHLGPGAFREITGQVVQSAMFVLRLGSPAITHQITAVRLVGLNTTEEKENGLQTPIDRSHLFTVPQTNLSALPRASFAYWTPPELIARLSQGGRVGDRAVSVAGLITGDSQRYIRFRWEVRSVGDFRCLANGGGHRKWRGYENEVVRWQLGYLAVYNSARNIEHYFTPGIYLTQSARGGLSARYHPSSTFSGNCIGVYCRSSEDWRLTILAVLNSRMASYVIRLSVQKMGFEPMHLVTIPLPAEVPIGLLPAVNAALSYSWASKIAADPVESDVLPWLLDLRELEAVAALLLSVEAFSDKVCVDSVGLSKMADVLVAETGRPAAWYPLIANYDALPSRPVGAELVPPPQEVLDSLAAHERLRPGTGELTHIKANLRALYECGPGAKSSALDLQELDHIDDDEETVTGAYIPIPAETFLEELSQTLQIHPISVYWLLEELRAEGVHCKPEELRLLEDRLSVLVLRLLGHRWPRQIDADEPVPSWVDLDGIIPLTAVAGEASLAERVRDRLRAEDGDRGAQQVEALLLELTGQTLDEWLRRTFFSRHVRQFKHRPIAWHLASTPTKDGGRKKAKREPAFQCLLYYHACRGDVLARLRAHYVEPLIRLETAAAAEARRRGDETAAAIAVSRVQELEEFAARLREVEESGFACTDLDRLLDDEALDRWSGDGIVPPANADELAAQERAWRVDINDGVRVNTAPLQLAGLLTSDVLRPDDARKAIADRARWRSDERRWVREGVLPRCGWMDEDVPESPRWTERAPEREAEQRKLEEKRRAVMARREAQRKDKDNA